MVKGESKKLTITVRNKDTGAVLDCSGASGILVGLYHEGGKTVGQWSKVIKTGFGTIDVTGSVTGVLVVYLEPSESLGGLRQKSLKAEIKVSFPNPAYPGGKQVNIDTNIAVEEVENSIFEGVDPD